MLLKFTKIIPVIICLLLSAATYAQQVKEKVIDFLHLDNAALKEKYPYNERVKIKIININRFLYKVSSEKTETDFNIAVPSVLSGITLPAFINTTLPNAPGAAQAAKSFSPDAEKKAPGWKTDIEDNIKALVIIQTYLNKGVDIHNKVVDESKNCKVDATTVIKNVNGILLQFTSTAAGPANSDLADKIRQEIESKMNDMKVIASSIDAQFANWLATSLDEYRADIDPLKDNVGKYKSELAELQEELKPLKPGKIRTAKLEEIRSKEKEIRDEEVKIENKKEDRTNAVKEMTDNIATAKSLIAEIKKFNEEGKGYTLVEDIKKINPASYEYYTEEVKMTKDEVKFDISAKSEALLTCPVPNEQKFTVKLRTEGGIKLDFSTGLFFNFGNREFHGEEYFYETVDESHVRIRAKDPGSRIGLALGALMHIYKRSSAGFKVGGAVGASVTTDAGVNFHAGPSFILGDKERFCLSFGLTMREMKILDRQYYPDVEYETKAMPEEVSMIRKFPLFGSFVSFTYNFSQFGK
ncbi:hypothetical protein [Foetidibacter luteolus]|uniref:hypothetical protein n=1 Tax=Foetidibacter luteolus TaxID=2608880 RepID=UPI00129C047A|nr:hypothetical protein [Foetidibacter luteolus]